MEQIDNTRVLLISVKSEVQARMVRESLPAGLPADSKSVRTWAQFRQALRERAWPVVHIVAREPGGEALELEDADSVARPADRERLAQCREELLPVSVVVLDGCYSEGLARSWLSHVDAVIGIPVSLSVTAAARFSRELYAELARAGRVIDAFDHAFGALSDHRVELLLRKGSFEGTREHTHPGAIHSSIVVGADSDISTLSDLLDAIRKGVATPQPVLVEARGTPKSMEGKGAMSDEPDWMEEYARAYALNWALPLVPGAEGDGRVTLGRSPQCDICIDDGSVSRIHASVSFERGRYYVMDEHSRNGTFINGEPLSPGVRTSMASGAYVSFGDALFLFFGPVTLRKLAKVSA
jgi:hypothetical protein